MRVAAIDDDIPLLQVRQQLFDHLIDCVAGFDHQHHPTWSLQSANQLFNRMRSDDLRPFCFVTNKVVHLRNGPVEDRHPITVIVHVENQILTHYGEPNETDVATCVWHKFH